MKNKKLFLKKETIVALDSATMSNVKGGFTYSLSTAAACQYSKSLTAGNGYQCGLLHEMKNCE